MGTSACPKRRPRGRTLHLIDVENLVDEPGRGASGADAITAIRDALAAVGWRVGDQVRIACNPGLASEFLWDVRDLGIDCHIRTASGDNGADLALLDGITADFVARRFDRMVVASGDGIFADLVRAVRRAGVPVFVVSHSDRLSHRLRTSGAVIVRDPAHAPRCTARAITRTDHRARVAA